MRLCLFYEELSHESTNNIENTQKVKMEELNYLAAPAAEAVAAAA